MVPSQVQTLLETLKGAEPENKVRVYFQPPSNVNMTYPCIRFQRDPGDTKFADGITYRHTPRYQVTIMDLDPDSELYYLVADLPHAFHERSFAVDNLNHDVFTLF